MGPEAVLSPGCSQPGEEDNTHLISGGPGAAGLNWAAPQDTWQRPAVTPGRGQRYWPLRGGSQECCSVPNRAPDSRQGGLGLERPQRLAWGSEGGDPAEGLSEEETVSCSDQP